MTPHHHARLQIESLEARQLLAGQILLDAVSGTLTIVGAAGADYAHVSLQNGQVAVDLSSAGETPQHVAYGAGQVRSVVFLGYDGDDRFLQDIGLPCTVYGGPGNDYLEGNDALDYIYGEDGNDILVGFGGDDRIRGGGGDDVIFGMAGNDRLFGELGVDYLYGSVGKDKLKDRTDYRDGVSEGPLAQFAGPYSEKYNPPVAPPPVTPSTGLTALETAIVNLTNQERQRAGLPALQVNPQLLGAARHHSQNMGRYSRMSHVLNEADLPELVDRLNYYGYRYHSAGENIAWNYPTAESVVAAWMNSSGHRANILNPNFTEIGVGIAYNSRGEPYYAQVFGSRA